jgi:DNA-directed RNA polymerase subunit RPC12/RpoP
MATYKCQNCSHEVIADAVPAECEICSSDRLVLLDKDSPPKRKKGDAASGAPKQKLHTTSSKTTRRASGGKPFPVDLERHQEQRRQLEREREHAAAARWKKKVEGEQRQLSKENPKPKPSFFQNIWNKGRCAIGAHKGEWVFDQPEQCTAVRVCELCGAVSTRTEHGWGEWRFLAPASCKRSRTCKRCGSVDYEIQHNWAHWEYLSPHDCTKVQVCSRCKQQGEETKVVHEWDDWKQNDVERTYTRRCRRCHEEMSRPMEEPEPVTELASLRIAEHPGRGEPISISGTWVAGDGIPVLFQQVGNQVFFRGANALGFVVLEGQGTVQEDQAHLAFRYFDGYTYDQGEALMLISPNGRQMDGVVQYAVSGLRRPMRLVR